MYPSESTPTSLATARPLSQFLLKLKDGVLLLATVLLLFLAPPLFQIPRTSFPDGWNRLLNYAFFWDLCNASDPGGPTLLKSLP